MTLFRPAMRHGTPCILFRWNAPCLWQFCWSLGFSFWRVDRGGGGQNWPPLQNMTSTLTRLVTYPKQLLYFMLLYHTGWGDGIPSMIQIALCFGLIVGTMVWCIGHISGGHINPAVTVALLVTRKISVVKAVLFVVAQCLGAIIGAAFLKVNTNSLQPRRKYWMIVKNLMRFARWFTKGKKS